MLSPQQYLFLTSQDTLLPKNFNKSENLGRVTALVEKMFKTFQVILSSQKLDQSHITKFFPPDRIKEFLDFLISYDPTIPLKDENNKLTIAKQMMEIGFDYYLQRFKETKFFSQKILEVKQLLKDLNDLSNFQVEEEEKLQLYRLRREEKTPPDIRQMGGDTVWRARCEICWRWSTGKLEIQTMKAIRHTKGCTYNKNDLENCIRTYQPRSMTKTS